MGATLDIPVHHIKAMLVRSHFDAVEIRVPDAPARRRAAARARGGRRRPAARPRRRLSAEPTPSARTASTESRDPMRTLITGIGHGRHRRHRRTARRRRRDPDRRRADRGGRPRLDDDADVVIDAHGTTAIPGLIDSHAHPVVRRLHAPPADGRLHRVGAPRRRHDDDLGGRGPRARPPEGHRRAEGARDRLAPRPTPRSVRAASRSTPARRSSSWGWSRPTSPRWPRAGSGSSARSGSGSVKTGADGGADGRLGRAHGMISTFHTGGPSLPGSGADRGRCGPRGEPGHRRPHQRRDDVDARSRHRAARGGRQRHGARARPLRQRPRRPWSPCGRRRTPARSARIILATTRRRGPGSCRSGSCG